MSSDFIDHVAMLLDRSLEEAARGGRLRQGRNFYARYGPAAYLSAVAAVEAFVNEFFLSDFGRLTLRLNGTPVVPDTWLERSDITIKVVLVPQLFLGRTLARDRQPYQDFDLMTRVRNELTHYKMSKPPTFVKVLAQRGIALTVSEEAEAVGGGIAWAHRVSTTEGIRWAYNTAVATVRAVAALIPDDRRTVAESVAASWKPVDDAWLMSRLRDLKLEPAEGERR